MTPVQRGAELLDTVSPDWADRIERSRLNLANSCDCILGQLYDDFEFGLANLDLETGETGLLGGSAADYGFTLPAQAEENPDWDQLWSRLEAEWMTEIERRRR